MRISIHIYIYACVKYLLYICVYIYIYTIHMLHVYVRIDRHVERERETGVEKRTCIKQAWNRIRESEAFGLRGLRGD